MMKLTEIACSTGSACTSSIPKPSHVLLAIGLNKEQINNTIRFGIGRLNNIEEIKKLGFDQYFINLWNYYFSYCEAGFANGTIDDVQLVLKGGKASA